MRKMAMPDSQRYHCKKLFQKKLSMFLILLTVYSQLRILRKRGFHPALKKAEEKFTETLFVYLTHF